MRMVKWVGIVALCLVFSPISRAGSVTLKLDQVFSPGGKNAPAPGTAGYMTAQFAEDASGGLDLTLDASHLLPSTKVFEFAFNLLIPGVDIGAQGTTVVPNPMTGIKGISYSKVEGGAGTYTVELAFSNDVLSSSVGNNTFSTKIGVSPTVPLNIGMVNTKGIYADYYAVAHFSTADSYYLGANQPPAGDTTVTPLPTAAFGGAGLLGLIALMGRGKRKLAA